MKPFMVHIKLSNPALLTEPPKLDSILAWCAVQEAGGEWSAGDILPLREKTLHGVSYWSATRFFYLHKRSANMLLTKRVPMQALMDNSNVKPTVPTGTGPSRAYNEILEPQWIDNAVAFGFGDTGEVEQLLINHLTHFGRNVRNGMGRVSHIEVLDMKEDWTEVIDGIQVATLPAKYSEYDCMARIKPPYWKKEGLIPVSLASSQLPFTILDALKADNIQGLV